MKTAISLPDSVFQAAEQFARQTKKSRSQLYVDALSEYLARHSTDTITDAMNAVCENLANQDTAFAAAAARQTLSSESW